MSAIDKYLDPTAPPLHEKPPVLRLNTVRRRRPVEVEIEVDGERRTVACELRAPGELGIADRHAIEVRANRVAALFGDEAELTDDKIAELEAALERITAVVLVAPPEVLERLSLGNRLALAGAFAEMRRDEARARIPEPEPEPSKVEEA